MSISTNHEFFIKIVQCRFISSVPRWRYSHSSTQTWRFYWNPAGSSYLYSKGGKITLSGDTTVLIPPYTPFSTEAEQPFSHFFIHFTLEADLEPARRELLVFQKREVIPECISSGIGQLSERQLEHASNAIAHTALFLLPDSFFIPRKNQKETLFDRAMKIIDQNPAFPANCEKLAAACGTSVNTLCRHFRKATGLPFKTWILNRKMESAAHLLLDREFSIKETADFLGFADRYHFSKVFKKYFGTTPAQFKREEKMPLP